LFTAAEKQAASVFATSEPDFSKNLRVEFNRLNLKLTMPKLRVGDFLVYMSEFHSKFFREYSGAGHTALIFLLE